LRHLHHEVLVEIALVEGRAAVGHLARVRVRIRARARARAGVEGQG
jgi:hypothetical protein